MRILIAEDEVKIANAIAKGLKAEGFGVDVVHDGESAVREAEVEPYDVIVLDWMMPGLSGVEALAELRQQAISVPVLMLTARDTTADKITGLNHGADDYLTKPFSFDELVARIRALSRRPQASLSSTLTAGDITLNTTEQAASRNNKPLSLSKKELALLELFMRQPGHVFSKDAIIGKLWSFDEDVLPNTVEAHIKSLRAKLDKPFGSNCIITVRGLGYKLEVSNV